MEEKFFLQLDLPPSRYTKLFHKLKKEKGKDIEEIFPSRSRRSLKIVFKKSPYSFWIILRLLSKNIGKLFIMREINPLDIPSGLLKLSECEWNEEVERKISRAMSKWKI